MSPQKICISKQVTFIFLIFLLLISYIIFAYWTSTNKTSTNSRASAPTMQINEALSRTPSSNFVISRENQLSIRHAHDGTIQYDAMEMANKLINARKYNMYFIKNGKMIYIDGFKNSPEEQKKRTNGNWIKIENNNLLDDTILYFDDVTSP